MCSIFDVGEWEVSCYVIYRTCGCSKGTYKSCPRWRLLELPAPVLSGLCLYTQVLRFIYRPDGHSCQDTAAILYKHVQPTIMPQARIITTELVDAYKIHVFFLLLNIK